MRFNIMDYKNTETEFAKTRIIRAFSFIIYSIIGIIPFSYLFKVLLKLIINKHQANDSNYLGLLYTAIFFVFFIIGLLYTVIIIYLIKADKSIKIIRYYKKNPLCESKRIMIPYDYKLWLTAPINTFLPMSFKLDEDDETHITDKLFTNCSKYNFFPKFKTPQILLAKNYIKNYAIIGYDKSNDKHVIVGFQKIQE